MSSDRKPTLSAYEASRVLGVTPATVYAWCRAKEIPSVRLGGRIRIPTAKLADLLGVDPGSLVADTMRREVDTR